MTFVNKNFLILVIVFINCKESFPQNSFEEQFGHAESLYTEENYFDAITEFKRLLFFDIDDQYLYDANRLIGLCYKNGGKYSDALLYFTMAEIQATTAEEIYYCRIESVKINILRRTTSMALTILDSLENDKRFFYNINEINYWRGWAYIFADNWELASLTFADIDSNHTLKTFCDSVDQDLYDATLAKALSIVPGLGQFYTGEYVSGLISIGWNVLWGYLTINAFAEDRIFDGLVIGSLLWWRFYSGNIQNAEKFALQKNLAKTNLALHYLQYDYTGNKP